MEKRLIAARDEMFNVELHITNFIKRAPLAIKSSKKFLKANPNSLNKDLVENAMPKIAKIHKLAKKALKDLDKLEDASTDEAAVADYYDGKEFRDRNKKLLASPSAFEKDASKVLAYVMNIAKGMPGSFPMKNTVPDVKVTIDSLQEFITHWNSLKIAINRI